METVITHGIDKPSYYWVLWYVPVLVVVLGWSYVTFIKKGTKE
jgi:cytochrome c-type biogenesis protein CcmH/NrfF